MKPMYISRKTLLAWDILQLLRDSSPLTCVQMGKQLNRSTSYTEQVMKILKAAKLVQGIRGPGGGYLLARHPDEITFASVMYAMFPLDEQCPLEGSVMDYFLHKAIQWGLRSVDRPFRN